MGDAPVRQIKYSFKYIEKCNMCGSPVHTHKILGKRLNQSQGKNPKTKIGITVTIVRCTTCGLIYSNPQPIPFSIQDHYGIPPESYWKEEYFVIDDSYFKGEIQILNKLLSYSKGAKSLDIGAGLGKGMIVYASAGFDAYGLEPSEPFYKKAIEQMKINPEKLKLGMIEDTDYPENYFDYITFKSVLEHIYDPSVSIAKAMKWLKPQGIMQIEVPSSDWLINQLINIYYSLGCSGYVGNISPMHSPFHLYEFTPKSFMEHSKDHNYEVVFHQHYVGHISLPKIIVYFLNAYMERTNKGMELCVWLRKR